VYKRQRTWTSTDTIKADLVASEDYIYIGHKNSFCNRYIQMGSTVNSVTTTLKVEYYNTSGSWEEVEDLIDETNAFSESGFIQWRLPDRDWDLTKVNSLPDIDDSDGYFWIRISTNDTMTVGTEIATLSLIWSTDETIAVIFPDITGTQFLPTGETNYYKQHELGMEMVASDLNRRGVIAYKEQIKYIEHVSLAAAYKTLDVIMSAMPGNEEFERLKSDFRAKYEIEVNKRFKQGIDINRDENVSKQEAVWEWSGSIIRE